jgi:hypothetical protein
MTKITEITRRDIVDRLTLDNVHWWGRLDEVAFLKRLYPLSEMPSTDSRFSNASGDIWQHCINNPGDWDYDWVFHDPRFELTDGNDDKFLRFLCETVHPVVRPDSSSAARLVATYNDYLRHDGFQLVEKAQISGRPVYEARQVGARTIPGIDAARKVLNGTDLSYVAQQIDRMGAAVESDPGLAIGTAKELIETCCKTILHERGVTDADGLELAQLVKATSKELKLAPDDIPDKAKAVETIRRLLSNLASIAQGMSELRNRYGTGHGKHASAKGLSPRHAKLAVGAASTLAVFLAETHAARSNEVVPPLG